MGLKLLSVMLISATLAVQGSNVEDEMYKTCLKRPCVCCKNRICSSQGKCNGCIDGFTGPNCTEPCPPNCFNCSQTYYLNPISDKVCYHCIHNYYNGRYKDVSQYTERNDCGLSCDTGCEICTSYKLCTRCKTGYFMSANKCVKCPNNCKTCFSPVTCLECEDGFYLNGTICEKCLLNCKTCYSPNVCTECNSNYFLSEGDCMSCPNGCLNCSTNSSCTSCLRGFYLDTYQCFKCKENCISCGINEQSQYICKKCRDEYYVFNDTCMTCGTGCVLCESHNDCYACVSGFSLQSNVCYNNRQNKTTAWEDSSFESSANTNKSLSSGIIVVIVVSCIIVVVLIVIAVVFRNREIRCCKRRFSIASCCRKDNNQPHTEEKNDDVERQSLLTLNTSAQHNNAVTAPITRGMETSTRIDKNSTDGEELITSAQDNQTEHRKSGPAPAEKVQKQPKQEQNPARQEKELNGSLENKQGFETSDQHNNVVTASITNDMETSTRIDKTSLDGEELVTSPKHNQTEHGGSASTISLDKSSQGPEKTSTPTDICTRMKLKLKVDQFEENMKWITREDYECIWKEIKPVSKVFSDFQTGVDTVMPIYDYKKQEKRDAAYIVFIESKDSVVNQERKVWREIWNRRIKKVVMLRYGRNSRELDDAFVLKSGDSTDIHVKCENIKEDAKHFTLKTYSISQAEETREVTLFDMPYPCGDDSSPQDRESREISLFHMPCCCGNKSIQTVCALTELQTAINKLSTDSSCPTLFHCSDENSEVFGIVGIYIAFDQLVKNEKETGYIEIHLCVKDLVKQFSYLVQNSSQYECIHSVLMEWIKARKRLS